MTTTYVRMADRETGAPAAGIDLGPLVGDFSCAAGVPGGIYRLRTEPHGTTLRVWAAGHGDFGPGELGAVSADAVLADGPHSRAGYAFLATFDDGEVCHQLQTYQGFGVFVVHGFHSFADQRQDYFSREFYVRTGLAASNRPPDPAAVAAASARVGRCDPAGLFGSWTNLNPAATGLAELQCVPRGSGLAVRVRAAGGAGDWGEALSHLYTDAANPGEPPALLATYDRGFVRVHLQARINRGVLVVAEYAEFTDGSGRSNFMMRECFWR
jgi:hypothetical protein